jgi:phosphoribosylformimino-5-aminoimidazole carboxamide ribotide isomerase
MIQVIPSITIAKNKVAILGTGDFANAQYYDLNPLDLALTFQEAGAKRLHLVDLDGARQQTVKNNQILQVLSGHTNLEINFSGGIRTEEDVHLAFESGAATVTAVTIATDQPEMFNSWLMTFTHHKLILGVDVNSDGRVASKGWKTNTGIIWTDMVSYFQDRGVLHVKLTDVSRDGVLQGPNFDLIEAFKEKFPHLELMVSGGVRSVDDIIKLEQLGVDAVIIAKAFYEDKLHLEDLKGFW